MNTKYRNIHTGQIVAVKDMTVVSGITIIIYEEEGKGDQNRWAYDDFMKHHELVEERKDDAPSSP